VITIRDINKVLPKIPNMRWGALTNLYPTNQNIKKLDQTLKHDGNWHTVFDTPTSTIIDDIPIIKKKPDSMT